MTPSKKKPDWDIAVLIKDTDKKGQVGAGWTNPDGSISLVFDPCVVINANEDISIRLFKRKPWPLPAQTPSHEQLTPEDHDDAPF